MLRSITATALFALSLTTAAQADPTAAYLNTRIQQAAENLCAPLLSSRPSSLVYKKWFADCVADSNAKITAMVTADKRGTLASN